MNPGTYDLTSQMRKAAALKRQRNGASLAQRSAPVRQWGRVTARAVNGAISISKTSVGIDRASDEQVEARLNVCRQCPGGHAVWKAGDVHTCGPMLESMRSDGEGACGCILRKKARDLAEDCPFGWWMQLS